MLHKVIIKDLGMCDYHPIFLKMQNFTLRRESHTLDEIWLLEHPPVYTQGINGRSWHILNTKDIPVIKTDRGGQVTYHGPGQLIGYVLFDLSRLKIGVRNFVNLLEASVIEMLADYGIQARTIPDMPGVYVANSKICSIGLRIRKGCSYHGIALNIENDLEPFARINPCGFRNLSLCKMNDFVPIIFTEVGKEFCKKFVKNLSLCK